MYTKQLLLVLITCPILAMEPASGEATKNEESPPFVLAWEDDPDIAGAERLNLPLTLYLLNNDSFCTPEQAEFLTLFKNQKLPWVLFQSQYLIFDSLKYRPYVRSEQVAKRLWKIDRASEWPCRPKEEKK